MATHNFMFSGADEEILKAIRLADDIATEILSSASDSTHYEASGFSSDASHNVGPLSAVVSDYSEDSGCPKLQEFSKTVNDEKNEFHMEPEYQNLLQGISSLQLMCDLSIEENRKAEAEVNNMMKTNVENSQQVLSVPMLRENLESIKCTMDHVQAYIKRISKVKQTLGKSYHLTMRIFPPCQIEAIQFFNLASDTIRHIENDIASIEACLKSGGDNWNQTRKQLQLQIEKSDKDIRRLDVIIEVRHNLSLLHPKRLNCSQNP